VTRRRLGAALVLVTLGLGACGGEGRLAFTRDERVEIVQPDNESEVRLPVRLRWTADIERRPGGGPYFAVFVDRAPVAPGQSLRVLADDSCNRTRGCPDADYFRDRFVYVTDERSLLLDTVPRRTAQRTGAEDRHEAIIVLIDDEGRRIGEAAYRVSFEVSDG
jgi:hypothetical protein